jgi:hypothetical protein
MADAVPFRSLARGGRLGVTRGERGGGGGNGYRPGRGSPDAAR